MKRSFWISLLVIVAGIVLIALPDTDQRLFSLNSDHGPSLTDTIGAILVFITWGFMLWNVFAQRQQVYVQVGVKWLLVCVGLIVAGTIAIVCGLAFNSNLFLWAGVATAVIGYGIIIPAAFKNR